ncbi:MAG: protein kinase [Phycisphaerae bacterium]
MGFRFNQGDRPVSGYTVQRGVGRGGFGEVYYAVSDGGKEVALKYLRDNPTIELRGVQACLNLKSPHLVQVFDVKQSGDGDWFVVMEYIAGPSLRDLMNDHPQGLGPQKAAYLTREIAKGLAYLHDRGIVHRDLKPGNVFYDEGYTKIGDYGLSKFIAASQHSGQTVSVGTVHYMAPEIGSGNYDRTIDIYALGVMLYEMLLGKVPFAGATAAEILMKHLTAQPEVDALPAPFPAVLRKALAKDPHERFQTVNELMAELLSVGDLERSVAAFEPASLSRAAAQAAPHLPSGGVALATGSSNVARLNDADRPAPPIIDPARSDRNLDRAGRAYQREEGRAARAYERAESRAARAYQRAEAQVERMAATIDASPVGRAVASAAASQSSGDRVALTILLMLAASAVIAFNTHRPPLWTRGLETFLNLAAVIQAVVLGTWLGYDRWRIRSDWAVRALTVALAVGPLLLLNAPLLAIDHVVKSVVDGKTVRTPVYDGTAFHIVVLAMLALGDWPRRFVSGRRGELAIGKAIAAGMFCLIVGAIKDIEPKLAMAAFGAAASFGVQLLAGAWPLVEVAPAKAGGGSAPPPVPGFQPPPAGYAERRAPTMPNLPATPTAPTPPGMIAAPVVTRRGGPLVFAGIVMICSLGAIIPALALNLSGRGVAVSVPTASVVGLLVGVSLIVAGGRSIRAARQARAAAVAAAASMVKPTVPRRNGTVRLGIGIALYVVLLAVVPILVSGNDRRDLGMVLPPVVVPLLAIGTALTVSGGVRMARSATGGLKLENPVRRAFETPHASAVAAVVERHLATLGYTLRSRGDGAWAFERGSTVGAVWSENARDIKTSFNVAFHADARPAPRLVCNAMLHSPWNWGINQKQLRALWGEMEELRQLLDAREVVSDSTFGA